MPWQDLPFSGGVLDTETYICWQVRTVLCIELVSDMAFVCSLNVSEFWKWHVRVDS